MVRVGIIGAGFGKNVHLPAFQKNPKCKVVGLCASHLENLKTDGIKIPKLTNQWIELVKDPDIDAISIAVPPAVQAHIIPAAIENGKHIFCEKPMALGFDEAKRWAVEADRRGLAHMVNFEFPELKTWQLTKTSLNKIAPILSVKVIWETQTQAHAQNLKSWKTDPSKGGGTLQNLGCHALYNIEWFLGPIETIKADLHENDEPVDMDLKMKNGAKVHIQVAANAPQGSGHRLEFVGKNGSIVLENTEKDYMKGFAFAFEEETIKEEAGPEDGRIRVVSSMVDKFIHWIEDKAPAHPSFWQGARNELLMDLARQSHKTQKPVAIPV